MFKEFIHSRIAFGKFTMSNLSAAAATAVMLVLAGIIFYQNNAQAYVTTVSATVATTVSCTAATTTTDFGALSSGSISTSAPNGTTTLSCNYGGGCNLLVQDQGNGSSPGLYAAAATGTPLIASANATLSAGTEGYGIQAATSSAGTGATLAVNATYLVTGNSVGGLLRTATSIASSTSPSSGKEIVTTHKAAISGLTKAGSYTDSITYSCTGQ